MQKHKALTQNRNRIWIS